jgi:UDP-hydrolysing UDP-N-acetyl-D-glucosamine 2-epimerase
VGAQPIKRVAVVTGSRADFGLLVPVVNAIEADRRLSLRLVAAGAHFMGPARTIRDVEALFRIAARVPMQRPGGRTRLGDARATARGVDGFARAYARVKPDWVVVLGDRIEAFAAAAAAAVGGIGVAHIHGGDRAEGIADESMRHAISKLAHMHLAATKESGARLVRMGERSAHVHVVGSPAVDGLARVRAMTDAEVAGLVGPRAWRHPALVMLLHPSGSDDADDPRLVEALFRNASAMGGGRVLAFAPNMDPGRDAIERLRRRYVRTDGWAPVEHLPRERWVGLLKWMSRRRAPLLGNSSAGLIEAAALGVVTINVGPRQAGRERDANVIDVPRADVGFGRAAARAERLARGLRASGRFGDGKAGERIARLLAAVDPKDPAVLRKRNAY